MSTRAAAGAKRRSTSTPDPEEDEPLAVGETEMAPAGDAAADATAALPPSAPFAKADAATTTNKKRAKTATTETLDPPFPAHLDPNNWSHFDHFLFQLLAFRVQYANFSVHRERHPALHAWLQVLKKEYKIYTAWQLRNNTNPQQQKQRHSSNNNNNNNKSQLTQQQVAVLEFYHIPLTSRGEDHWMRFYSLLCQYRERHGHCLVPRLSEVPGLGDWVTDQRRQYKQRAQGQQTSLTEERQQMLDHMGFVWQVRCRPEWDRRYEELLQYKAQHGEYVFVCFVWRCVACLSVGAHLSLSLLHISALYVYMNAAAKFRNTTKAIVRSASGWPNSENSIASRKKESTVS